MQPEWTQLERVYTDYSNVTIVSCDCTRACANICKQEGVVSFPTLKLYHRKSVKEYEAPRNFPAMHSFIESFKDECTPRDRSGCKEWQLAIIHELEALPRKDLLHTRNRLSLKIKEVEQRHNILREQLQAEFAKSVQNVSEEKGKYTPYIDIINDLLQGS